MTTPTPTLTKDSRVSIGLMIAAASAILIPAMGAYMKLDSSVDDIRVVVGTGFSQLTTEVRHVREVQSEFNSRLADYAKLEVRLAQLEQRVNDVTEQLREYKERARDHD